MQSYPFRTILRDEYFWNLFQLRLCEDTSLMPDVWWWRFDVSTIALLCTMITHILLFVYNVISKTSKFCFLNSKIVWIFPSRTSFFANICLASNNKTICASSQFNLSIQTDCKATHDLQSIICQSFSLLLTIITFPLTKTLTYMEWVVQKSFASKTLPLEQRDRKVNKLQKIVY